MKYTHRPLLLLFTLFASLLPAQNVWRPAPGATWQWQLTTPVDLSIEAQMYDIDLFENDASVVAALHAKGRVAVCYVSVGTYEPYRPDSAKFPAEVKGRALGDFPDETWLDIRRWDILGPIFEARFDLCKAKGFDALEPDNVDGYSNRTGFPLTAQDQLTFNRRIAQLAHARGLSVGLKNDLDQVATLVGDFDWALNEQCFQYQECSSLAPFIKAGKAVFNAEYTLKPDQFCPQANSLQFSSLSKHVNLDAYRVPCSTAAPNPAPAISAVVNAGSYATGGVSPGEIVALFGSALGPVAGIGMRLANGRVATDLDQIQVLFDGVPAPLVWVGAEQATAVVPYSVSGKARTTVQFSRAGTLSATVALDVVAAAPAIFTANASGKGGAAALNQDFKLNTASNRAKRGSVVTFYATGEGLTTPLPKDGEVIGGVLPVPVQQVKVRVGGKDAPVLYAGAAPQTVAGVLQVNLQIPSDAPVGDAVTLELIVGGKSSQAGVTLAVAE
ncbi:MAG: endo alpha-1,4 polygalactosaminidase [Bryobacteraceae bacterium]